MDEKAIEKLAELAKIRINPGEAGGFAHDFESILGYIKSIESVDIGEVSPEYAVKNVMREDVDPNEPGANSETLLAAAPATHEGFVKVNKIL